MTSDLAAFASEEPLSTADGAIPLTQVASRKTSVSWMEALACIQQICDAVIASGKGPLDESSIYLHDSGTVSIEASGETTPEESVRFVGDLLCAWLEGTPHPMALDTILLAAADSPPSYASVAEFAAALKPYERPERAQRVRAVYHRAGGPVSTQRTSTSAPLTQNLEPRTENREPLTPKLELRTENLELTTENSEPSPFRRSHFRTPYIVPDAVSTSTLLNHQLQTGDERPVVPAPARRSVQDVVGDVRRRIVSAFHALAERLRPLLKALLSFLSAVPTRLRPLAKPLLVLAVAAVALAALGVSGWLLVSTFTTAPAATARGEAPTAKVAVAAPAPPATPAAKIAVAPPVATSTNAAASKAPPAATSAPARVAATATPATSAKPEASITERATATVDRALAAILPPANPRRTTSIVLEPDRASPRTARPSARTASARSAPTPSSSAPVSPFVPPESAPAIELQAAAPPVPETTRSAEAVAAPAAVAPKYPAPPPPAAIYTSNDADVVPPVQTYPRYVESIGPNHPDAAPFQVVIDENGLVESAVLARYPANMRQAVSGTLLLAAAKAWRFQPATKDGHPVKYRRIIWFSNQ